MARNDSTVPFAYEVRLHTGVREEILAEYTRIFNFSGSEVARGWKDGLYDAFASLETVGGSLALAPEAQANNLPIRQLIYRRKPRSPAYRVLYLVLEDDRSPRIIRVLHIRQGAQKPLTLRELQQMFQEGSEPFAS